MNVDPLLVRIIVNKANGNQACLGVGDHLAQDQGTRLTCAGDEDATHGSISPLSFSPTARPLCPYAQGKARASHAHQRHQDVDEGNRARDGREDTERPHNP